MEDEEGTSIEDQEDDAEDTSEDNLELSQELNEQYATAGEPQTPFNQWQLIKKAIEQDDTVRTTYLTKEELGKPLFTVRFLMDMEDVAHHYLKDMLIERGLDPYHDNIVARYLANKYQNISSSGMSNQGFTMNLSVTRKTDATKKRIREVSKDGGKTKP